MGVVSFDKSYLRGGDVRIHSRHENVDYEMHRHEHFELIYYSGCSGVMRINGYEYEIKDECIFLLTPTDFHEISTTVAEGALSIVVAFSEAVIDEALFSAGFVQPCVTYEPDDFIAAAFNKMHEIYRTGTETREIFHLINYALSNVTKKGLPVNPDNSYIHPKIREAVTYRLSNIDGDCSLEAISTEVGLSPSYFSTKFLEVMKKPYRVWLQTTRLDRAKRMLESTDDPIINVAYECGYSNPSHFIKIFKKSTGYTPKSYRKISKKYAASIEKRQKLC